MKAADQVCPKSLADALQMAKGHYNHLLSLMATVALVRALSCKRFMKSVGNPSEKTPDSIVKVLSQTMASCKDMSLDIPGQLQAMALKYVPAQK